MLTNVKYLTFLIIYINLYLEISVIACTGHSRIDWDEFGKDIEKEKGWLKHFIYCDIDIIL